MNDADNGQGEPRLVHYHTDDGTRVALVEQHPKRRKWLRVVEMHAPLMVRVVHHDEQRYMRELAMPRGKARRSWRHAARTLGADAGALALVRRF